MTPAVGRPETDITAKEARDERLVDRTNRRNGPGIMFSKRFAKALEGTGKIGITKRIRQPGRRSEMNQIGDKIDAQFACECYSLICPAPIKHPGPFFYTMPGESITKPGA